MPKTTKDLNIKANVKVAKTVAKKNKKVSLNSNVSNTKSTHSKDDNKKVTVRSTKSRNNTLKSTRKKPLNKTNEDLNILEYYDLPYRYNKTIVKMLAQSPHTLFVYWDVSDLDKEEFIQKYGNDFFSQTKPVLVIHNKTKNYTFEIDINDYANCWYFNVDDEKCEYLVELGRKPISNSLNIPNNYIFVTSSNEIESPNGHILFEKEQKTLYFRNVKNNSTYSEDAANLQFVQRLNRIYKIYDLYKVIYKNDEILYNNNTSSSFK